MFLNRMFLAKSKDVWNNDFTLCCLVPLFQVSPKVVDLTMSAELFLSIMFHVQLPQINDWKRFDSHHNACLL